MDRARRSASTGRVSSRGAGRLSGADRRPISPVMTLTLSRTPLRWGHIAAFAAIALVLAVAAGPDLARPAAATGAPSPSLAALAARSPHRPVEVIVQLRRKAAGGREATALIESAGGRV